MSARKSPDPLLMLLAGIIIGFTVLDALFNGASRMTLSGLGFSIVGVAKAFKYGTEKGGAK